MEITFTQKELSMGTISEHAEELIKQHAETFNKNVLETVKRAEVLRYFEEESGIKIVKSAYDIQYCSVNIARSQLPKIRSVVGQLELVGKYVPWDYEREHQIVVQVKAKDKRFDFMMFEYRRPHSEDSKCKVVEQQSTYKALVCSK